MRDSILSTQRWWATTKPTAFFAGAELHISDTPNPKDWALLYRWKLCKGWVYPLSAAAAVFLAFLLLVTIPDAEMLGKSAAIVVLGVGAAVTATLALLTLERARRKPFSIITLPVQTPEVLDEQLEELWPQLDARMREGLRKELITTFESKPKWSPQALQQAVLTRVERYRARALDG